MDLVAIREALADAIHSELNDVNVYPYMPQSPRFPCIVITTASDYLLPTESFDPAVSINYDLLTVDASRSEDAQRRLDELAAPLMTALEAARGGGASLFDGLADDLSIGLTSTLDAGDPNASVFYASTRVTVYANR